VSGFDEKQTKMRPGALKRQFPGEIRHTKKGSVLSDVQPCSAGDREN